MCFNKGGIMEFLLILVIGVNLLGLFFGMLWIYDDYMHNKTLKVYHIAIPCILLGMLLRYILTLEIKRGKK